MRQGTKSDVTKVEGDMGNGGGGRFLVVETAWGRGNGGAERAVVYRGKKRGGWEAMGRSRLTGRWDPCRGVMQVMENDEEPSETAVDVETKNGDARWPLSRGKRAGRDATGRPQRGRRGNPCCVARENVWQGQNP
jgi:hypothetical protein